MKELFKKFFLVCSLLFIIYFILIVGLFGVALIIYDYFVISVTKLTFFVDFFNVKIL